MSQILTSCTSSQLLPAISMVQLLSSCNSPSCLPPYASAAIPLFPTTWRSYMSCLHISCLLRAEICVSLFHRSQIFGDLGLHFHHPSCKILPLMKRYFPSIVWLFFWLQHKHTSTRIRASACWHSPCQSAIPRTGVGSGGDMEGWLLAVTEFPSVVYRCWQLGNSISYKTGRSCLILKLWSRNSSWGLWKHNKLYI